MRGEPLAGARRRPLRVLESGRARGEQRRHPARQIRCRVREVHDCVVEHHAGARRSLAVEGAELHGSLPSGALRVRGARFHQASVVPSSWVSFSLTSSGPWTWRGGVQKVA